MSSLNDIYRQRWLHTRRDFEISKTRTFPRRNGARIARKDPIGWLLKVLKYILEFTGLSKIGLKHAASVKLTKNIVHTNKVGTESLRILHLSDLHLDESVPSLKTIEWAIKEADPYDYAVITGDLVSGWSGREDILENISEIFKLLKPLKSTYFVLGNHDSLECVEFLENLGVCVLTNQIDQHHPTDLSYGIDFIGTDDPHYFYTDDAIKVLQEGNQHYFRVALIHTPELYREAQENGIDLYLCGHTHAGQFALPGGFAPLKRVYRGKKFYKRKWNYKSMSGYTSTGLGTTAIKARFFTQAEVTLHEIKSKNKEA